VAVGFLPFCYGAIKALGRVLYLSGQAETFWIALLGGVACWLAVYLVLPKPMWVYVFGHELTHVLWAWMFGARVKRFKVSSRGGHVVVSKSNFLIALAPYFFPLYALLVVLVFWLGDWIWGWGGYLVWFHWLVGMAYGFHVTLTWQIMHTQQSDITTQGTFFSLIIIFLGNIAVVLLGVPLLSGKVKVGQALIWWGQESWAGLAQVGRKLLELIGF